MPNLMTQAGNDLEYRLVNQATGNPNELYMMNVGQVTNTVALEVNGKNNQWPALYQRSEGNANASNFTLALVFQGHILDPGRVGQISLAGKQAEYWKLNPMVEGTEIALYFLYNGLAELNEVHLLLHQLAVNTELTEATSMELRYCLKGGKVKKCQQIGLRVLSHRGSPKSPFKLWLDTPRIGTSQDHKQQLKLRLLNISGKALKIPRLRLQLSFDVHEKQFKSPEGLVTDTEFNEKLKTSGTIKAAGLGKIKASIKGYQGIIDFNETGALRQSQKLKANGLLQISIENFNVYPSPGITQVQLSYFNVEGFWDGALNATVQRSAIHEDVNGKVTANQLSVQKIATGDLLATRSIESAGKIKSNHLEATETIKAKNLEATANIKGQQIEGTGLVKGNSLQSQFKGKHADLVPPGTIVMWSGDTPPTGWALCDGRLENGKQTPNLSGRFVVGIGKSENGKTTYRSGNTGGLEEVVLTKGQMPKHSHKVALYYSGRAKPGGSDKYYGPGGSNYPTTYSAGNDQPHENRPPYYALAYIIKL